MGPLSSSAISHTGVAGKSVSGVPPVVEMNTFRPSCLPGVSDSDFHVSMHVLSGMVMARVTSQALAVPAGEKAEGVPANMLVVSAPSRSWKAQGFSALKPRLCMSDE